MNSIKKVVLVGNGFDLAHNLKTSYDDFVKKYADEQCILEYKKLVKKYCIDNDIEKDWYCFEKYIEEITYSVFQKNFKDGLNRKDYVKIKREMDKCNNLFLEISKLLKEYLEEEGNEKLFHKLQSIERVIDEETFVISFNYTNTIKAYTQNYEYIHGSICDDDYIILGCATGNLPDAATGPFAKYLKSRQIEELAFRRFLNDNKTIKRDRLLKEFEPHLVTLYSGRGEYDLPLRKCIRKFKLKKTSKEIKKYAESNNYEPIRKEYSFSYVDEIVIAGHSLETDLCYISGIFHASNNLKRIRLFTYNEESSKDIKKKTKVLQELIKTIDVELIIDNY